MSPRSRLSNHHGNGVKFAGDRPLLRSVRTDLEGAKMARQVARGKRSNVPDSSRRPIGRRPASARRFPMNPAQFPDPNLLWRLDDFGGSSPLFRLRLSARPRCGRAAWHERPVAHVLAPCPGRLACGHRCRRHPRRAASTARLFGAGATRCGLACATSNASGRVGRGAPAQLCLPLGCWRGTANSRACQLTGPSGPGFPALQNCYG